MSVSLRIPSIKEFVLGDSTEVNPEQQSLIRLLDRKFYGSLAPVPMMTRAEMRWIPLIGNQRISFIDQQLEAFGLRFRDTNQGLKARAVQLFGSIDNTPVNILTLSIASRHRSTVVINNRPCYVARCILEIDRDARLGSFIATEAGTQRTSDQLLRSYIERYDASSRLLQASEFTRISKELRESLSYWITP